ncbi:antibiotic biosynthesis monooxygenase [Actinomadura fibrosa]|uniref:Antibiotic biosynthesis monooxygenase n=1 Tax=Actinomadura fibrosa TaxID=111802 RepID=A0ABW2XVL0_9ACTN|nr:antibiotic biosynthesis monooxygenase [Actinomadura fibrosa]
MIARVWQARTSGPRTTEEYRRVFQTEVLTSLRGIEGFRGAYLLARSDGDAVGIETVTLFESLDAVRSFAGKGYEREHVTPAARAVLLDSDPLIRHFDVLTAYRTGEDQGSSLTS